MYDSKYVLLKRRENKLNNSTISNFRKNINIKNETIFFNDLNKDNMIILKADMKLNLIGKIYKLIYRIPEVIANVETENGNKYSFRILLEQLNNGMIIDRIPFNLIEFKDFFEAQTKNPDYKVKSINFTGKGLWLYKSKVDFVFHIMEL